MIHRILQEKGTLDIISLKIIKDKGIEVSKDYDVLKSCSAVNFRVVSKDKNKNMKNKLTFFDLNEF